MSDDDKQQPTPADGAGAAGKQGWDERPSARIGEGDENTSKTVKKVVAEQDAVGRVQRIADKVGSERTYKLENPKFVRGLIFAGIGILTLILLIDPFLKHKEHFEQDGITIDAWPEFFPLYGFVACLLMVVVSKAIGLLLKRKDTYYEGEDET